MNRSYHWKSWNKNHQNSWCFCYTFEELCVKFVWQQLEWTMPRQDDWHCVVTNVQVKTAINRFRLSSQFTFMWRWVLMFLQYNPLMHSKLRCGRGNESTSWYNVADWITFLSSLLMSPFCCCFFFQRIKISRTAAGNISYSFLLLTYFLHQRSILLLRLQKVGCFVGAHLWCDCETIMRQKTKSTRVQIVECYYSSSCNNDSCLFC